AKAPRDPHGLDGVALARGDGSGRVLRADRRLDLGPLVVVLDAHAADGVLELAHALAERAADLGEALRPEEEQREQQEQDDLAWADVRHGSTIARFRQCDPVIPESVREKPSGEDEDR